MTAPARDWLSDWERKSRVIVCPTCQGEGAVISAAPLENPDDADQCPECRGIGWVRVSVEERRR